MWIPEPDSVYPECLFQETLIRLVESILSQSNVTGRILKGFGLDIAVFMIHPQGSACRFLEVKTFGGQRMGGVGFGNQKGEGIQVDLLLEPNLTLFDPFIRWVYADATRLKGTKRYALFTCSEAKDAAMGDVKEGKQNNLSVSKLAPLLKDWPQFCAEVQRFLQI